MEYFSESARALVARAAALSGGGELLPEHLLLVCESEAVPDAEAPAGESFFGAEILGLFERAYQLARLEERRELDESHLRRALVQVGRALRKPDPEGRTLADLLDDEVALGLAVLGLNVEAVRGVAATFPFDRELQKTRELYEKFASRDRDFFFALICLVEPGSREEAAWSGVGLTRERCERLFRSRKPPELPAIAKSSIRQLHISFEAGESGQAALFLAWMLAKRRDVGVERLLQGTLAADLMLNRAGGAADRVRAVGAAGLLTQLPSMVDLQAEGESFSLHLSAEAEAVVRRCRAGFESEDLLTELLSEDCWEALGSEFVALRDRLR